MATLTKFLMENALFLEIVVKKWNATQALTVVPFGFRVFCFSGFLNILKENRPQRSLSFLHL